MKKTIIFTGCVVLALLCIAALPTTLNTSQFNSTGPLTIKTASQAEAEAGVENNKMMTALRVAQAITAQASGTGDLLAANNLNDVDNAGQSRTNLVAHDASNLTIGTLDPARGGTGDDTSATTGMPMISAGNWTYNAASGDLADSANIPLLNAANVFSGTSNHFAGDVAVDGTLYTGDIQADTITLTGDMDGASITNLQGSAWSRAVNTADNNVTNYVVNLTGAIYQFLDATNNVDITLAGLQSGAAVSVTITASGDSRTLLFPTNVIWLSTNNFTLSDTNWALTLPDGKTLHASFVSHTTATNRVVANQTLADWP